VRPLEKGQKWEDRVSSEVTEINVWLKGNDKDYRVAAGKNEDGYYLVFRRLARYSPDDWFHTSSLVSNKPREFALWLDGYVNALYNTDPRDGMGL
jgi:hypothetical protein